MIPKRVRQFYINVTDKMSKEDYIYAQSILNEEEFKLFNMLLKSEQKHSVRIARQIEQSIDSNATKNSDIIENRSVLVKAALLHDIGKIRKRINVFDKSIIVILNKLTNGNIEKFKASKKIQCYYHHSEYSYEIVKEMDNNELLLHIIRNHHNEINDNLINFFQRIDDDN